MEAKIVRLILITVVIALAAGCAGQPSVSENQCRAGDWETLGYRDGSQGQTTSRLLSHQEACGEYGIVPDRVAYMAGWDNGNATYCVPETGFSLGERGRGLTSVCQGVNRSAFVEAYEHGRALYVARDRVQQIDRQIRYDEKRLQSIDREMIEVNAAQLKPELTAEQRVLLVADFKELLDERERIEDELPHLYVELKQAEAQLDYLVTPPQFGRVQP